jgi:cytochrome o ubiquinol oxidase subunit 3
MPRVGWETGGAAAVELYVRPLLRRDQRPQSRLWTQVFLLVTGLLGLIFVGFELFEFIDLASRGIVPQRSGFLSAFFGLVGLHGLHVTLAGMWLLTMMAQVQVKGFRPEIVHRLICFNLFWHALDIVWIGIFTIVYLMGATHEPTRIRPQRLCGRARRPRGPCPRRRAGRAPAM